MSSKRQQQRQQQRQQRQRRSVRGGMGASDYAISTYGDASHQMRGADGAIAMNQGCTVVGAAKGGSSRSQRQRRGGRSVLMDVAVPAVLLYANNNVYPNKTAKKPRKYRRSTRRSRR